MEAFLKNISLSFLLRSVFGGVFLILSFRYAVHGTGGLLPGDNPKFLEVEIPIALFAGVTVYALHRAYVYPFIEALLDWPPAKKKRSKFPCSLIRDETVFNLYRAWGTGVPVEKRHEKYTERLTGWADTTQFLYVASLSILIGHIGGMIHRSSAAESCLWLLGRFLAAIAT